MRLATLRTTAGTTAAARLDGDQFTILPFSDVADVLRSGTATSELAGITGAKEPVRSARIAPLVPKPSKIFCVGLNYRTHIMEMGEAIPAYPTLFAKFAETLVGAADDVAIPDPASRVDWEAELVAVVGRRLWRVDSQDAASGIAGFAVGNDVSVRDYQSRTSQWLQGKCFQATTPVGPYLLTADESGTSPDLEIRCAVNGVVKQKSRTSDLLFGVADLLSYISAIITLEPGDLVFTGTPAGVGQGRPMPEFLHPGDVLETSIDGIGTMRNRCVAGWIDAESAG